MEEIQEDNSDGSELEEPEDGSNEAAFGPLIQQAKDLTSEVTSAEQKRLKGLGYKQGTAKDMANQMTMTQTFKAFATLYTELIVLLHNLDDNDLHQKVNDEFQDLVEEYNTEYAAKRAVHKFAGELRELVIQENAVAELDTTDKSEDSDEDGENLE